LTAPTTLAPGPDTAAPVAAIGPDATHGGFDVVRLGSEDMLEASFAPHVGMTCCSLRHGGAELLGERFGLEAYASCGTTMGMSLMHPWADRLSSWNYSACGATVCLPVSPLLHTDVHTARAGSSQPVAALAIAVHGDGDLEGRA
jgi:hypothetical protein